jgi:uncharacterized protein YjdB
MMKTIRSLYWLLALTMGLAYLPANASVGPAWTFDPHAFEYDMTLYVSLQRNGAVQNPANLTLAAFAGNECRGLATLLTTNGSTCFYLRVRSRSAAGEVINFRCYDSTRGVVDSILGSVLFENLKQIGYPSVPHVLSLFTPVSGVQLDKSVRTLQVMERDTLLATILPSDASDKRLEWQSDNPTIASVDGGRVSALKAGSALVSVKTVDGGFLASCRYTILQPVTGLVLNREKMTLNVNQTDTLLATVLPSDASNRNLVWSSDQPLVASVVNGVVKGLKAGQAVITVKTVDGGFSAQCLLTVHQPVTGVVLDKTELYLLLTQSVRLQATVSPVDASNKAVGWTSSNPASVSVVDGLVTAIGPGQAVVTVKTAEGGFTAACSVRVPAWYSVGVHLSSHGIVVCRGTGLQEGDSVKVLEDSVLVFHLTPDKSSELASVVYNGVDVTNQVKPLGSGWYFTTPPVKGNGSLTVRFQLQKFELNLKDAESGSIGIAVEPFQKQTVYLHVAQDWELYSVLFNGVEVIGEVVSYTYTTPVLTVPSTLQMVLRKIVSVWPIQSGNRIQLSGSDGLLQVRGILSGNRILVYDLEGKLVRSRTATATSEEIRLPADAVYTIKVADETYKLAL